MKENTLYMAGVDIGDGNDYTVLSHYGELIDLHIRFNKGMIESLWFDTHTNSR